MKLNTIAMMLISVAAICSCATMFSDKAVKYPVISNPEGAAVSVFAEQGHKIFEGTTPCTIEIEKAKLINARIVIERTGYKTVEVCLGKTIEPTAILNVCCFFPIGSAIGALVDYNNGSMFRTESQKLDVILESAGSSVHNGDTATFTVAAADGATPATRISMHSRGEIVYMAIEDTL